MAGGMKVTSDGTDNHLMVCDVTGFELTGRQAESALRLASLTLNRNSIPFDPNGAWYTSGLRFGTPALTTLGMKEEQMLVIAEIIIDVLKATKAHTIEKGANAGKPSKAKATTDEAVIATAKAKVERLLSQFVLYPELDLDTLKKAVSLA